MIEIHRVLISDDIDAVCLDILRAAGVHVTLNAKMSKEELLKEIEVRWLS